jgi:ribonuclease HI
MDVMSKKKEEVIKEQGMKGVVLFADGSARPNPGFAGWGLHGYLYEAIVPKKGTGNPDYVLTENDYLSKTVSATVPEVKLVTPLQYVDGYGGVPVSLAADSRGNTNNQGELMGVIEALKLAIEHGVEKLRVWTDSQYVVTNMGNAHTWQRNGWRLSNGEEAKNLALWKEFLVLFQILKEKGVDFAINWNKGHAGNYGNEIVDGLAFVGMRHATHGIFETKIVLSPAEGYWKYEANRHPFISHRRMYYNTLPESNLPGEYCLGEHDKDDDLAGKRQANGAYAYIRLDKPENVLEQVRRHSCKLANGEDTVMIGRVDYIYRAEVHEYLDSYGDVVLNNPPDAKSYLDAVIRNKKEPVTTEHWPPLLIGRTEQELGQLKDILDDYLKGEPEMVTTDLTPLIYESIVETSKKGEEKRFTKLRPEFIVGMSKMEANVNYRHPKDNSIRQANINLILGLDLLDRNALRRLEELEPEVRLVTWLEEPLAFRFATIIKVKGAVGIWAGTYSNFRIILD